MSYFLVALIVGLTTILVIISFTRRKNNGQNNLFEMLILGIATVVMTIYCCKNASYKSVGALSLTLAGIWMVLAVRRHDLVKKHKAKAFHHGKAVFARVVGIILPLTLISAGWIVINKEGLTWGTGLLMGIPLIMGVMQSLVLIYVWMKKLREWLRKF